MNTPSEFALWDSFAGQAMAALLNGLVAIGKQPRDDHEFDCIARTAYDMAFTMIATRACVLIEEEDAAKAAQEAALSPTEGAQQA